MSVVFFVRCYGLLVGVTKAHRDSCWCDPKYLTAVTVADAVVRGDWSGSRLLMVRFFVLYLKGPFVKHRLQSDLLMAHSLTRKTWIYIHQGVKKSWQGSSRRTHGNQCTQMVSPVASLVRHCQTYSYSKHKQEYISSCPTGGLWRTWECRLSTSTQRTNRQIGRGQTSWTTVPTWGCCKWHGRELHTRQYIFWLKEYVVAAFPLAKVQIYGCHADMLWAI